MVNIYLARCNGTEDYVLAYYDLNNDFNYMAGPLSDLKEAVDNINFNELRFINMHLGLKSIFSKKAKANLIDVDIKIIESLESKVAERTKTLK